jgi:hypothetical protein
MRQFALAGLLTVLLFLMACGPAALAPQGTEVAGATVEPTTAATQEVTATEVLTDVLTEVGTEALTTENAAEVSATGTDPDPVVEGADAPSVELAEGEAQEPSGRVIAPAGVNVRTGPGTNYRILGVAPQGTEGEIVGVSEDGAWWVAHVPSAPNEQGWVAAAYVEATNTGNVPVIPAPPLEAAQAAPAAQAMASGAEAPAATLLPVPDELDPGSLILFSASRVLREGNRAYDLEDIYSVAPTPGSTAKLIIQNAMQPSVQRGGTLLAFRSTQADGLGISAHDFGADARVRFTANLEDSTPRFSPTGDRILFSSNRTGDRRWKLYIIPNSPRDDRTGFPTLPELTLGKDADWHPSQDRIVFKGCDDTGNNCGLWTINADGSERAPLTNGFNDSLPRWSPDGASVIFMSDSRDGNWELYTLSVAGGTVTRLTDNAANDGLPAWSPDGSRIAFMSNRDGAWGIWVMPASGGEAQRITQLEEQLPDWLLQGLDWPR